VAAEDRQAGFLDRFDDVERDARFGADPLREFAPVGGAPARLGRY
jgi:hypothetical protein